MSEELEHIGRIVESKLDNLVKIPSSDNKSDNTFTAPEKKHGGLRPGGGRPKGALNKKTLDQRASMERWKERVRKHTDELFDAQLDLAKGEKVLMVKITERDDKGKAIRVYHEVVTDRETMENYMNYEDGLDNDFEVPHDDEHYYYLTVKPANNQALEGMMNRTYGKAPEKIEIEGGFFKVDNLTINIVEPPKYEEEIEGEAIDGEVADEHE